MSVYLLLIGGPFTFILAGIISTPLWLLCKNHQIINGVSAGIAGIITGLFIAALYVFLIPTDFSGNVTGVTREGIIYLLTFSAFGGINGWLGFYMVWKR